MRVIHFLGLFILFLAGASISYWIYSANLVHYYYYGNINELYFEPIFSDDEALVQLSVKLKYIYDLVNAEKDYMDDQIKSFRKHPDVAVQSNFIEKLQEIESGDQERINFIKAQLEVMFSFNKYLDEQLRKHSLELDEQLDTLKRKASCSPDQVVLCKLNLQCDYSCQFQKLSTCLFAAYFNNRSILIQAHGGNAEKSLLKYLEPSGLKDCKISESDKGVLVVDEKISLEQELVERIVKKLKAMNKFHGEPMAWFAGHFIKHLTSISDSGLSSHYSSLKKERYLNRPYIGYYAPFNSLDTNAKRAEDTRKFINYLNEYYDIYLLKNPDEENKLQRAVYLVTDDKFVYDAIKSNYSQVKILNEIEFETSSTSAKEVMNFFTDLHFMAKSDYIICKMAFSFCRLSYEYMQWNTQNDRSKTFRSMDVPYNYNFDSKFYKSVIRDQMIADQINSSAISADFNVELFYTD